MGEGFGADGSQYGSRHRRAQRARFPGGPGVVLHRDREVRQRRFSRRRPSWKRPGPSPTANAASNASMRRSIRSTAPRPTPRSVSICCNGSDIRSRTILRKACSTRSPTSCPSSKAPTWENLGDNGKQWPIQDGGLDTQILHTESFKRGLGQVPLLQVGRSGSWFPIAASSPSFLTTGRILEHYNCGTMTRRTGNALIVTEDVLSINPIDAEAEEHQRWGSGPALLRPRRDSCEGADHGRGEARDLIYHVPLSGTHDQSGDRGRA